MTRRIAECSLPSISPGVCATGNGGGRDAEGLNINVAVSGAIETWTYIAVACAPAKMAR
jgi:hypothetical protein